MKRIIKGYIKMAICFMFGHKMRSYYESHNNERDCYCKRCGNEMGKTLFPESF